MADPRKAPHLVRLGPLKTPKAVQTSILNNEASGRSPEASSAC